MEKIYQFLEQHSNQKNPLLIGYSGGPDSKALLYAVLDWGKAPVQVAHVDHGWRYSSEEEAEILRREVEELNIPFHSIRLQPEEGKNLEAKAREKRFAFFEGLFYKTDFQALLLGHHQADLAETALKRVFEGACLPFLGGMEWITKKNEMPIWRPLLNTTRSQIFAFLKKKQLSFIDDPTNRDPHFLRSRMREQMFPMLNQMFGKNVTKNLSLLSARAYELKQYLDRKIENCPVSKGPWGLCFRLPQEKVEARHLIQKFARLPRDKVEEILDHPNTADWAVNHEIFVDRGSIFFLAPNKPEFGSELVVQPGLFRSKDWEILIQKSDEVVCCDWQSVWSGRFSVSVSGSSLSLLLPPVGAKIKKWWTEAKVPSFLRRQVPVLKKGDQIVREFLSGRTSERTGPNFKITFSCVPVS